jgi:hypothetical protein
VVQEGNAVEMHSVLLNQVVEKIQTHQNRCGAGGVKEPDAGGETGACTTEESGTKIEETGIGVRV